MGKHQRAERPQLDLFGELVHVVTARRPIGARAGVGRRHAPRPAPAAASGYLGESSLADLRQDTRLRELAEIGLSSTWLGVARILGYDAFVLMWRHLSADPSLRDDNDQIELHLRPFRSYERYQRNRYIETLAAAGLKISQIHQLLRVELGEKLSDSHLNRLIRAAKVRP